MSAIEKLNDPTDLQDRLLTEIIRNSILTARNETTSKQAFDYINAVWQEVQGLRKGVLKDAVEINHKEIKEVRAIVKDIVTLYKNLVDWGVMGEDKMRKALNDCESFEVKFKD